MWGCSRAAGDLPGGGSALAHSGGGGALPGRSGGDPPTGELHDGSDVLPRGAGVDKLPTATVAHKLGSVMHDAFVSSDGLCGRP